MAEDQDHNNPVDQFYREKFRNAGLVPAPGSEEAVFNRLHQETGGSRNSGKSVLDHVRNIPVSKAILSASLILNGVLGYVVIQQNNASSAGQSPSSVESPSSGKTNMETPAWPDTVYIDSSSLKDDGPGSPSPSDQPSEMVSEPNPDQDKDSDKHPASSNQSGDDKPASGESVQETSPDTSASAKTPQSGKSESGTQPSQEKETKNTQKSLSEPDPQESSSETEKETGQGKDQKQIYGDSLEDFYEKKARDQKDSSNRIFIEEE